MATITWQQIQNRFINQAQSSTTELDQLFTKIRNQQSLNQNFNDGFAARINFHYQANQSLVLRLEAKSAKTLIDARYSKTSIDAKKANDGSNNWSVTIKVVDATGIEPKSHETSTKFTEDQLLELLQAKLVHYAYQDKTLLVTKLVDKVVSKAKSLKMVEENDNHTWAAIDPVIAAKLAKPLCEFQQFTDLLEFMNEIITFKAIEQGSKKIGLKELVRSAVVSLYKSLEQLQADSPETKH
ncbi:MAG: hypothetical protein O3C63_02955 [Cyanobacteria bacterium]|nr:hypothetical protein [Cyanobacteriota bacterium]